MTEDNTNTDNGTDESKQSKSFLLSGDFWLNTWVVGLGTGIILMIAGYGFTEIVSDEDKTSSGPKYIKIASEEIAPDQHVKVDIGSKYKLSKGYSIQFRWKTVETSGVTKVVLEGTIFHVSGTSNVSEIGTSSQATWKKNCPHINVNLFSPTKDTKLTFETSSELPTSPDKASFEYSLDVTRCS